MDEKIPMTKKGYQKLSEELTKLKFEDRPAIIAAIEEARGQGDLSENAEYQSAREQQSFIEGRSADLEAALSRADVIDIASLSGDTVRFGSTLLLQDCETDEKCTYQIVGQYEADLEHGLISLLSPIARALIGKKEGEIVEVKTPKGSKEYEILKVQFVE